MSEGDTLALKNYYRETTWQSGVVSQVKDRDTEKREVRRVYLLQVFLD